MRDRTRERIARRREREEDDDELPVPWQRIQGAIWILGIGFLIYTGDWIPGIFILLAISGLFQGGVQLYLNRQEEQKAQAAQAQQVEEERANWLPAVCPKCGGPINVDKVKWTGRNSANCPYCSANIRPA